MQGLVSTWFSDLGPQQQLCAPGTHFLFNNEERERNAVHSTAKEYTHAQYYSRALTRQSTFGEDRRFSMQIDAVGRSFKTATCIPPALRQGPLANFKT